DAQTTPGTWYLDRSSTPWVLTYLANPGEDPTVDTVVVPKLTAGSAQSCSPASNCLVFANQLSRVTFRGLTFSHDNFVTPVDGIQSIQAEPTVPAALSFLNAHAITFDACTVSHTAAWGIEFVGDNTATADHFIFRNGAVYDTGGGGIRVGRMPQAGGGE